MAASYSGPSDSELRHSLSNLLETGKYSDLKITCGADKYNVHKAIVCTRSPFFAAACDGEFKEAKAGEIDLPDDDPVAVKMMIRYLYLQNYKSSSAVVATHFENTWADLYETEYSEKEKERLESMGIMFQGNRIIRRLIERHDSPPTFEARLRGQGSGARDGHTPPFPAGSWPPASPSPVTIDPVPDKEDLILHAKVYALGEKYGINGLKSLALQNFLTEASVHHHAISFYMAASEVYSSTIDEDRAMRAVVVDTLKKHPDLLEQKSLQSVIKDTELGLDLLMVLTQPQREALKRGASSA